MDDNATTQASPVAPRPAPDPTTHPPARRLALAVLLLLVCGAVAIVVARRQPEPGPTTMSVLPTATTPPATTEAPFPSDTASDVVSYADHVALVTAVAEADAPPRSTTTTASPGAEHIVMRTITFRVDRTLWSRPDAPAPPARFTSPWWGWLLHDGKRTPFIVTGAPVVFLGAQYVMPIAYDGSTFSAIQPFAVFRMGRDGIRLEEQDTPLAKVVNGLTAAGVAATFADARPDPLAASLDHLLARQRLAAVLAATNGE